MAEKRRYRQSELEIENITQRERLIKDDLEGLDTDFARWVREGNKRKRRADAAVRTLLRAGLATDYRQGLEHLQEVVGENLDSGALSLRKSDFQNRFHFFGTRDLVKRPADQISQKERAGFSLFAYGALNHRVAFDAMEGKLPRANTAGEKLTFDIEQLDSAGETQIIPVQQGVLFDRSGLVRGSEEAQLLTPDGQMTTTYAFDAFYSLYSLQEMTAQGNVFSNEFFDEVGTFEGLMAPVLGTHFDDLQAIRDRFDYDGQYVPALMSVGNSVLLSHGQPERVLFREVPVISWQKNKMSGGRIDALEITEIEGRAITEDETEVLAEFSQTKPSSVGELLVSVGDRISPFMTARIIDVKCSLGDGKFNQVIDQGEIVEGPIPRHEDQVRDYLTHAPIDRFTHEYEEGREINAEQVWNDDDEVPIGEILYIGPRQMPRSFDFSMTPEEKEAHFRSNAASKLERARENARTRSIDTIVGRYIEGVMDEVTGKKGKKRNMKPFAINPQMLRFMESLG